MHINILSGTLNLFFLRLCSISSLAVLVEKQHQEPTLGQQQHDLKGCTQKDKKTKLAKLDLN